MLKPSKGCIEFLAIEPDEGSFHLNVDASFFTNLFPMGILPHVCSRVRLDLGPSRAGVGLALAL